MTSPVTTPAILVVAVVITFAMQDAFATETQPTAYTNLSLYGRALTTEEKIGNRTLELDISVLSSNNTHTVIQFRPYDANTNQTIKHVTYLMNITEVVDKPSTDDNSTAEAGKLLVSDFFHTHGGILTFQLEHAEGQDNIIIHGEKGDFLKAWMSDNRTGVLYATSPPLWNTNDDNLYHFNATVFGIDRDTNIFPPDEEPVFEKVVTVSEFGSITMLVTAASMASILVIFSRLGRVR